jgi:hypothetical protein
MEDGVDITNKHTLSSQLAARSFDILLHLAVQKPTIKFGQNDRPSREIEFTPTRGKNKGITRTEREYYEDWTSA